MATFVGRSIELGVLHEAFRATERGQMQTVAIAGDAGIGKTRLIEELRIRTCLGVGTLFCIGHCLEYVQAPYLPFWEIFASIGMSPPKQDAPGKGLDEDAKFRYFTAVADSLIKQSTRRTLIIAIEDMHWADDATIELVQYLALRLQGSRVLLLLTQRSDSPQSASAVGSLLIRLLRSGATQLHLRPLGSDDVFKLVTSLAYQKRIPPDLVYRMEAIADGNPLFLEELVRTAGDHAGAGQPWALEIPLTIKAMLSERMLSLTNQERDVLLHAAVIGREFDLDFLCDISSRSRTQVLAALQSARDLQLIVHDIDRSSRYSFRHALLRETLYSGLLIDIAGPLHARVAARMETNPQTPDALAELAYHWTAAGIEDKAIEYNERAGDAAADVFAYSDAARFYGRALRFRYPAGPRRASLHERLALALRSAGGGEDTRNWFERAYEDYQRLGDVECMMRVLLHLAFQHWLDCNTVGSLRCTTQAIDLLGDRAQPELLVRARLAKAGFCSTLGRVEEARALLGSVEAMDVARDDETNALFYEIRAETEIALDFGDEAEASVETAAGFAARTGSGDTISRVENMAVITCALLGRFDAANVHFEKAVAAAREHGLLWRESHACVHFADTLVLAGRLPHAREVLEAGLGTLIASRTMRACAAFVGIPLAVMLEDRTLLARLSDEDLLEDAFRSQESQRLGPMAAAFAEMYLANGDTDRARALIRRAVRASERFHFSWRLAVVAASLCEAHDRTDLEALLATAPPARQQMSAAFADLVSAVLNTRFGAVQEGMRLAESAAQGFSKLRCPLYEARALEAARRPYDALAIYEVVGDRRAMRRMRREIGLDRIRPTNDAPLTARQREVAALMAKGASNREIAGRLSITQNTVEHHVSEIFSRLGVSSRGQLAARLLGPANDLTYWARGQRGTQAIDAPGTAALRSDERRAMTWCGSPACDPASTAISCADNSSAL